MNIIDPSKKENLLMALLSKITEFFTTAFTSEKSPFVRLLILLIFVLLLGLVLINGEDSVLRVISLVVVIVLVVLVTAALEYLRTQNRYNKRTIDVMKQEFRETVQELLQKNQETASLTRKARILFIEFDPPGRDVDGEFVKIQNMTGGILNLRGWTLRDDGNNQFAFNEFILKNGGCVRVWTKKGQKTATDLYWGKDHAIWSNRKDCGYLIDNSGRLVDVYRY